MSAELRLADAFSTLTAPWRELVARHLDDPGTDCQQPDLFEESA